MKINDLPKLHVALPMRGKYGGKEITNCLSLLLNETKEPLLWCGYNEIAVNCIGIERKKLRWYEHGIARPVGVRYTFNNKEDMMAFKLRWFEYEI